MPYMGWTLDYALRMIPLLERVTTCAGSKEPVIPDDIAGYAALRAMRRIPIAGGEHEFIPSTDFRQFARLTGSRLYPV